MPCFYPLDAWQSADGSVHFFKKGTDGKKVCASGMDSAREIQLSCGQCVGCRLKRSRDWALRIMHEVKMHKHSCFVTLTYNEDSCPRELIYKHFRLFVRKLRKRFPNVRFYMCGEYGEQFSRPHFHACLFGVFFSDQVLWKTGSSGFRLYRSFTLESLWKYGFSSIGDVTLESAQYVAGYIMKKVCGKNAEEHYQRCDEFTGEVYSVEPEFSRMSKGTNGAGGIGSGFVDKFHSDFSDGAKLTLQGGVKVSAPEFERELLSKYLSVREIADMEFDLDMRRVKFASENAPDRLAARETVARARLKLKQRTLEKE